MKPHKLLHVSQTRWLSLHAAVARVLEQWNPLTLYFTSTTIYEETLHSTKNILEVLKDYFMKPYFIFLNYILAKINKFNLVFQQSSTTIQLLYKENIDLYKDILLCYMKRGEVKEFTELNPENESKFIPLNQIYLGSELYTLLQKNEYINNPEKTNDILLHCKNYMVELSAAKK